MVQHDQRSNYVIMWFKKWISDIKFHQNHDKLWLLMGFIDFYVIYDPGRSRKRSKMIKNNQKWSKMIKKKIQKIKGLGSVHDCMSDLPGVYGHYMTFIAS